ncbi:hypothetical protein FACS189459_3670 [Bacilli bacterium]|nr:hypothetical protein FACS189459_3670 [Bacilli bacterium]
MNKKKFKLLLLITIPVLAIAAAIPLTTTLTSCNKNGSGESESLDAGKLSNVQFVDSDFSDIFQFMYDQDSAGLLYGDFFLTIYPILPKNSVTIGIEDYPAEPTEPVLPQDETDGGAAEEVEEGSPGS